MQQQPHPYDEAIEFLLTYVERHGDKPAQESAQLHLGRIRAMKAEDSEEAPQEAGAGQPA